MTEGKTLSTWKRIIKHYIEDVNLKPSNIKKILKKTLDMVLKKGKKRRFYYLNIKTFNFFGQKSKKKMVMFFSVISYGITRLWHDSKYIFLMKNLKYIQY